MGAFTLTTAGPASAFFQSVSVLTTQASPGSTVGNPIFDTATLGGAPGNPGPTGTITFDLYGPDDPTCARGSIFTSIVPVTPAVASDGDSGLPLATAALLAGALLLQAAVGIGLLRRRRSV